MKPTATLSLLATAIAIASCSGNAIEVRSIKQNLAEGRQPANSRVAEGNGQLALGNVGLAIEAYRKALREQPDNVEAMMGLATCYDRMGRSDLSRRHYEMALAVEPANTDVYSQLAQSLDRRSGTALPGATGKMLKWPTPLVISLPTTGVRCSPTPMRLAASAYPT